MSPDHVWPAAPKRSAPSSPAASLAALAGEGQAGSIGARRDGIEAAAVEDIDQLRQVAGCIVDAQPRSIDVARARQSRPVGTDNIRACSRRPVALEPQVTAPEIALAMVNPVVSLR